MKRKAKPLWWKIIYENSPAGFYEHAYMDIDEPFSNEYELDCMVEQLWAIREKLA